LNLDRLSLDLYRKYKDLFKKVKVMNPQTPPPATRQGNQSQQTSNLAPPLSGRRAGVPPCNITNQTSKQTPLSLGEGLGVRTKDKLLKQIINYLRLNHALDAAFLISKQTNTQNTTCNLPPPSNHQTRTFTYTLLIFINKTVIASAAKQTRQSTPPLLGRGGRGVRTQPNPAQITDELYNHTQKQAKVYLIMMDAAKASDKLDIGCNFLVHFIKNSPLVFSTDKNWLRFKNFNTINHPIIDKEIKHEWGTRFKRATYLHNLTVYNEMDQDPVAYFEVLQKVIEQTCLGLIYVFWQYKPSYTGLPYLLHLCSLFTDLPSKIFNTNTFENHQILHNLTHATNNLKYKTRHSITQKQIDKAWKKCHTFLQEAEAIVTKHLQID